MKNYSKLLFLFSIVTILGLSCCSSPKHAAKKIKKIKNTDYQEDALDEAIIFLNKIIPGANGTVTIRPKKDPLTNDHFIIDIVRTGVDPNIKLTFLAVPHHPLFVWDSAAYRAMGFLEVSIVTATLPRDGTTSYEIDIPKSNMYFGSSTHGSAHVLTYSRETGAHKDDTEGVANAHVSGHKLQDPRGGV